MSNCRSGSALEVTEGLEEEIYNAIAMDDVEKFNSLLEQGVSVSHYFKGDWIWDVLSSDSEIVNFFHWSIPQVIVMKNALKIADSVFELQYVQSLFPYKAAVANAVLQGRADMIRLMISKGFDPNKKSYYEPPLLGAVINGSYECCEALVKSGLCNPYVKARYSRGKEDRPLSEAARQGRLDIVKLIVEFKKDKKMLVRAAVLAAENGHEEVALYLLDSLDVGRKKGSTHEYPYHMAMHAVKYRMISVIERLLRVEPRVLHLVDSNRTMLSVACEHNHIDLVEYFVGLGADVHATDKKKYLVYTGKEFVSNAATEELLKECNSPPKGAYDMKISLPLFSQAPSSPLAEAVAGGHLEIVKKLVEWGVNPGTAYVKSFRSGIDSKLTYNAPAIDIARGYGHAAIVEYLSSVL